MVRFIIRKENKTKIRREQIYIPIWLDLLLKSITTYGVFGKNLHSNMVRFIIVLRSIGLKE